jgi:bifunctional non-homologous end joining protein LigD
LAFKLGSEVRLLSRNGKDLAGKFPLVAEAVAALSTSECVLDGEIVALDEQGRSSFQRLQALELGQERPPLFYYVFDLLRHNRKDLQKLPLEERKSRLRTLLRNSPPVIRYSPSLRGSPARILEKVHTLGLEGLIGKRSGSMYEAGARSGAWIKLKLLNEQEMVIGGYTDPEGSRKHFGALLVGCNAQGKLNFVGKVGTGFNATLLKTLHQMFARIALQKCPFANLPEKRKARFGQAITATAMKRCHWVKPLLVCQVRFAEWTRDGKLRQPVFLGLREDKDPTEVVREKPA